MSRQNDAGREREVVASDLADGDMDNLSGGAVSDSYISEALSNPNSGNTNYVQPEPIDPGAQSPQVG